MDDDDEVLQAVLALREYAERHATLAESVTRDLRALGVTVAIDDDATDNDVSTCTGAILSFTRRGVELSWQIDEQALDGKGFVFLGGPDPGPWQSAPLRDPMVNVLAATLTRLGYTVELELDVFTALSVVVTGVAER